MLNGILLAITTLVSPAELPQPNVAQAPGTAQLVRSGVLDRVTVRSGKLESTVQRSVGTLPGAAAPLTGEVQDGTVGVGPVTYTTRWVSHGVEYELETEKTVLQSTNYHAWIHKNLVASQQSQNPPTATAPVETQTPAPGSPVAFTTSWTTGGGAMVHTVRTPPSDEHEDPSTQAARHAAAVEALQAHFPPDDPAD